MKKYVTSSKKLIELATVVMSTLSLSFGSDASPTNRPIEEEALVVAEELKVMIFVGAQINCELQYMINSGYPDKSRVDSGYLIARVPE